jgi:hypothetical protein
MMTRGGGGQTMSEETIFALALEQPDPTARAAFLDTACNGDAALRQRVEAMLRAHEQVGDFLERPALDQFASLDSRSAANHGRTDLPDATEELTPDAEEKTRLQTQTGNTGVADADRKYPEIPGYEILGILGHGGMGVVYRARQLGANRLVALKMLRAVEHASPTERLRFQIETEAVARLQHPHIVQLHEVGEVRGQPFFSLELCDGGTLAQQLKKQRPTPRESAQLIETLARAMHYAHLRGVVHRDLKPANVLLAGSDRLPKITDFGLARQLDADSGQTQTGHIMGTPSYMAPEQASGRTHDAGPAADIYALGAILYECLSGRPPFQGKTVVETLDQVRTQEPVPPSRLRQGLPRDLETICLKCLRKERDKRYASAAELADDLQRYQRGEPILARRVGGMERAVKWVKRNPWLAGAAALVVLALAVGTTVSYLNYRETQAANDKLLNVGARGLLRPLQPSQGPLNDQEVEALWELAGATDEALRLRFVEVGLADPTLLRRLTARAAFAFQATVGLSATRRKRVEQLLGQRLQARESAQGGRVGDPPHFARGGTWGDPPHLDRGAGTDGAVPGPPRRSGAPPGRPDCRRARPGHDQDHEPGHLGASGAESGGSGGAPGAKGGHPGVWPGRRHPHPGNDQVHGLGSLAGSGGGTGGGGGASGAEGGRRGRRHPHPGHDQNHGTVHLEVSGAGTGSGGGASGAEGGRPVLWPGRHHPHPGHDQVHELARLAGSVAGTGGGGGASGAQGRRRGRRHPHPGHDQNHGLARRIGGAGASSGGGGGASGGAGGR